MRTTASTGGGPVDGVVRPDEVTPPEALGARGGDVGPTPGEGPEAGGTEGPVADEVDPFGGLLRTRAGDGGATPLPAAEVAHEPATMPMPVVGPATAAPVHADDAGPLAVERSFAFVDVCGFTAYCDRHGERAAIEVLTAFRSATRDVVGRRGVRVAKWLGDGVMLVGTSPSPLVASVVEVVGRARALGLETHAGIASGPVLLFEGDDYVGRTVNLAARLCDAAGSGEVLASGVGDALPDWVRSGGERTLAVAGMGRVGDVHPLLPAPEVQHALGHRAPAA